MDEVIAKLAESIKAAVNFDSVPYQDKAKAIRAAVDAGDLEEFLSWFDVDDEVED